MKTIKNNLKTFLALSFTIIFFLSSCKKTDSDSASVAWSAKKTAIQNKVKSDLTNLKALLPYTVSRAVNGDVSFDNQKINEYFGVNNTSLNKISTISKPKSTNDIIASIKAKQLSSLTPVGEDTSGPPTNDPLAVLIGEGYRNQYYVATQNFLDLATYITTLNGIATDMLNSFNVTDDEKVMMYNEIEYLKQFATDIETNPDYWIDLYAPLEQLVPMVSSSAVIKNNVIMSTGSNELGGKTIMGPPHRPGVIVRQGCKINTRAVLMGAVISGFGHAVNGAILGAGGGTIVVPGLGTASGAVSGFMVGFAVGFTKGVVFGVMAQLALSCGR